jgi:hyperosmotically inducible protein
MRGTLKGIPSLFALTLCVVTSLSAAAGGPPQGPGSRDSAKYQAWLQKEVRHELVMLPYYSVFDNLAFKIEGDRVILLGQVVRPSTKSDAEARVKKLEGVSGVVNQIEVLPASPMDDKLRWSLYRAIYSDAALQKYSIQSVPPIHIIVKNGHATLEGVVANEADKNIANIRANGVAGVFSVTNNLRVEK